MDTRSLDNSTSSSRSPVERRVRATRNKGFNETHQEMIETAVRLISEKGVDSLSVAAVARTMGVNRTTVYYHFNSREALLDAVKAWSSDELVKGLSLNAPQQERIDYVSRFVLENPELIKLWIEDFVSPGDIRNCYPYWDTLLQGIKARFAERFPDDQIDAEVYCVIILTSAIIGPLVFKNSVCPETSIDTIVRRFTKEHQRMLKHDALLKQ